MFKFYRAMIVILAAQMMVNIIISQWHCRKKEQNEEDTTPEWAPWEIERRLNERKQKVRQFCDNTNPPYRRPGNPIHHKVGNFTFCM